MKIKTNNTIIGIICTADEKNAAFDALVEVGVDPYLIYTKSHKGKTVHCFMSEDLPFEDFDTFKTDFTDSFNANKATIIPLKELFTGYFDPSTTTIGGRRICQYA